MSDEKVQNFENHVRNDPKIFAVLGVFLLALIVVVADAFVERNLAVVTGILLSFGGLLLGFTARSYSTGLQDRIIRTEMRIRLGQVLQGDLAARIPELATNQLIALRFESDANLPDLVQKVLDENITSAKEIKKQVKDWQADWHRV